MKQGNVIIGLCAFLVSVTAPAFNIAAQEKCELVFSDCLESFNGDTVVVPEKVYRLSSFVHACRVSQSSGGSGAGGFVSILFMIDNTGSMKGTNGNDPTGARFTVTKDLLDTIIKAQPDAEVGLVLFREHLFFDTASTGYYADYFKPLASVLDSEPNQAYLPFLGLSTTYEGRRGIDIIKDILTTNSSGDELVYQPNYRSIRPNPSGGETNINGAFMGAKQAFLAANNPKDRQYIIFLSDGEPAGTTQAGQANDWFTTAAGVAGVPTTFTVYFADMSTAPASLTTMTNNIKTNAYSASNSRSNIWPLATSYNALMDLLMQNVVSTTFLPENPLRMTVNGTASSTTLIDSMFLFSDSFPLINELTPFSFGITYRYLNPQTNVLMDTVVSVSFYIKKASLDTIPEGTGLANCVVGVSRNPIRLHPEGISTGQPFKLFTLDGREIHECTYSTQVKNLRKGIYLVKNANGVVNKYLVKGH